MCTKSNWNNRSIVYLINWKATSRPYNSWTSIKLFRLPGGWWADLRYPQTQSLRKLFLWYKYCWLPGNCILSKYSMYFLILFFLVGVKRSCACLPELHPWLGHRAHKQPPFLCIPPPQLEDLTDSPTVSALLALGANLCCVCRRRLCILRAHWEYSEANEYLMTVPPLLSAQADDLLTFRHSGPDKLLRAELSVTGAMQAPCGIDEQGYLRSRSRSNVNQRATTTCWSDTSATRTQELLAQQKCQSRHGHSALAAAQYLHMSTHANVMRFHFDYVPVS